MTGSLPSSPAPPSAMRRFLAWSVHFYTALGLVCAALMAVLIINGTATGNGLQIRLVFILMIIATLIDATDGTFARLIRIKEVLPGFDGRRLDDLIDFLNFTFLPLLLIWRLEIIPPSLEWCLLIALIASAYGFCQVEAKTPDGFFLGFPSYWNLVAFYLYVLQPLAPWFSFSLILLLSMLTFIPLRYLYPSQPGKLNMVSNGLGVVWMILAIYLLFQLSPQLLGYHSQPETQRQIWAGVSLFYPVFYLAASWFVSWKVWINNARRQREKEPRK